MVRWSPVTRTISRRPAGAQRCPNRVGRADGSGDRPIANALVCAILGLALSAAPAPRAGAQRADAPEKPSIPSWYAQTIARGEGEFTVTNSWSLRSKLRSEVTTLGRKIVTIVDGDTYYAYDAIAMTGIAIRRAPEALAMDSPNRRPFGNEAQKLIEAGAEKIRDESVGGKHAEVYQLTDDSGRRVAWVTRDERRLPIRIEFFDRQSGTTRYREYVDWVAGIPLSDAFFQPEPGIQFERFELEAYIEKMLDEKSAPPVPILYGELLRGPTPP